MINVWQDIRYGFRMLSKNPGFTVVVVMILAIGIGANTAIFSVVNAVMLRPLPYKDPDRIVIIQEQGIPWMEGFEYRPNFFKLRQQNSVFESLGGSCGCITYVTGIENPHEVWVCDVTWNLFPLLGIQPLLGRWFLPEDEKPQSTRVVVLSHTFWKDYFNGSSDAIGKSINLTRGRLKKDITTALNSENYTIVGVMPPGFDFPYGRSVPFWTPMVMAEESGDLYPLPITSQARLKRGITLEKASAELTLLASRLRKTDSSTQAGAGIVRVRRLLDTIVEGHRKLPLLLLGAAGFVLLIACSNVANLFLARASVRQREVAMRLALGASRGRVMRQMLTESSMVSLGAGVLGLVLTCCTVKGLVHLYPSDIPRLQETGVDFSVLGFTLGASMLTGLLFGMVPACRASDICMSETLKAGAGWTTSGRGWRRLHSGLVVSQLGLSLILLFGAGLLIRSLVALGRIDLGFQPENVLAINLDLPEAKYSEENRCKVFFEMLLERLRTLPHVRSAAVVHNAYSLTELGTISINFTVPGRTNPDEDNSARILAVSSNFFETMGIKLLRGQPFTDQNHNGIIIDKFLAEKYFPNINPVGQSLFADGKSEMNIIGVADTMRDFQTPEPAEGVIYLYKSSSLGFGIFLVRTDGDPMRLIPSIRMQVADLEKDQVIKTIEPLEATLSQMLTPRRFVVILLGLFAGIAVILAAVGVYGLLQYSTTQRIHDIGVRMALGARSIDILRAVLGQGFKLITIGVLIGLFGAVILSRILSSLLYGVTPTDPLTLACASLVLALIALLASYLPARRAAKIDPMEALRYE